MTERCEIHDVEMERRYIQKMSPLDGPPDDYLVCPKCEGEPVALTASNQPVCAECGRPESEHSSGREQWCPAAYRPNTYKNRPAAWQSASPAPVAPHDYWPDYQNAVTKLVRAEQEVKILRQALKEIEPASPAPVASDCCGDAHMELQAALDHIAALGFTKERRESGTFAEEIWHNTRAEKAEAKLVRAEQELKRLREARILCDKFIAERKAEGKGASCLEAVRAALGEKGSE